MLTVIMNKLKKKTVLFIVVLLFFLGMGYNGPMHGGDTSSYISMHLSREPLYPLFLAFFRAIFGIKLYLWIVCVVQCLLAAISIYFITILLLNKFNIRFGWGYLIVGMLSVPYWIDTVIYSPMGIRTNYILTEGIVISFFYFFLAFLFKAVWDKSFISLIYAMIFVFLMVSCRTQMLVTVVPLVFVLCICMYRTGWRYKLKAIGAFGLMLVLMLGLRIGYSSVMTRNVQTYSMNKLTMLTNFLFVADEDDAERFENPELKKFFIEVMDRIKSEGVGASGAHGLVATADWLHENHDYIKYQIVNDV